MRRNSKTLMSCGHVETHHSPHDQTTQLDRPCQQCEAEAAAERHKARVKELTTQLLGQDPDENAAEVQRLTERANSLQLTIRRGLAEVHDIMYGPAPDPATSAGYVPVSGIRRKKATIRADGCSGSGRAPWDPESDSGSEDDGRSDTSRLSDDGKHVIQKQYKLIEGHWALICYRMKLEEVDPILLAKLRRKRDREELARQKEEERKNGGRSNGSNRNSHIKKGNEKGSAVDVTSKESKAASPQIVVSTQDGGRMVRAATGGNRTGRKERERSELGIITEQCETPTRPSSSTSDKRDRHRPLGSLQQVSPQPSLSRSSSSSASNMSSNSFRARVDRGGSRLAAQMQGHGQEREPLVEEWESAHSESPSVRAHRAREANRNRAERLAQDMAYNPATMPSQRSKQKGKSSGHDSSANGRQDQNQDRDQGWSRGFEADDYNGDDEQLDMWQRMADEYDEGGKTARRNN